MTRPTEVCTCTGRGDMLCVGCYNRTRRLADPCYELRRERDEARAEVEKLRAVVEAAKVLRQPEARGFSVALGEYAIWGAVQVVLDALAAYETT